jgi:hypothetical protein
MGPTWKWWSTIYIDLYRSIVANMQINRLILLGNILAANREPCFFLEYKGFNRTTNNLSHSKRKNKQLVPFQKDEDSGVISILMPWWFAFLSPECARWFSHFHLMISRCPKFRSFLQLPMLSHEDHMDFAMEIGGSKAKGMTRVGQVGQVGQGTWRRGSNDFEKWCSVQDWGC